jgi:hypothetical protein
MKKTAKYFQAPTVLSARVFKKHYSGWMMQAITEINVIGEKVIVYEIWPPEALEDENLCLAFASYNRNEAIKWAAEHPYI